MGVDRDATVSGMNQAWPSDTISRTTDSCFIYTEKLRCAILSVHKTNDQHNTGPPLIKCNTVAQ